MASCRGLHRLPDPVPALKAELAATIVADMAGWRVDYAGARIGSDYSGMSKLRKGDLRRFSLQTLVRMAARIGLQVTLTTQAVPRRIPAAAHESLDATSPIAIAFADTG